MHATDANPAERLDPHGAGPEPPPASLAEEIGRQFKSAPWYLTSTAVHMTILLLLMLVPTVRPKQPGKEVILKVRAELVKDSAPDDDTPKPEPIDPEQTINNVVRETASQVTTSDVVEQTEQNVEVDVNTEVAVEFPDEPVGDPSEDTLADPADDAAPNLMGVASHIASTNLRGRVGAVGDIGRGIRRLLDGLPRRGGEGRKLCLVWLLDQSFSMKDDQAAVAAQAADIQDLLTNGGQKKMLSGVITFGSGWRITQPLTTRSSEVAEAIYNVPVDTSGVENACQAIAYACQEVMARKTRGWTKVLVLLTDESASDQRHRYRQRGDGGLALSARQRRLPLLELARQALRETRTRLFVVGKESPFQSTFAREKIRWTDGRTHLCDVTRGPESPQLEVPIIMSQNISRHARHEFTGQVKAGFGVYDLAYLATESRGAYFILDETPAVRMSPRERARRPFTLDYVVLEQYKPLMVSRTAYRQAMLDGNRQARKVLQLNEFLAGQQDQIHRYDRARPPSTLFARRACLRARKAMLVRLIDCIGGARATDDELLAAEDRRQMANIDLWYCVLLADQLITEAWLDAFERYRGDTTDTAAPDHWAELVLRAKPGASLSEEETLLFTDRMDRFRAACNDTIRRHSNTPWATAAHWMQKGPARWGKPFELIRVEHKRGHNPAPPRPVI